MTHGTFTSYVRGCRCAPCTAANRQHARDRYQRQQQGSSRRHLTPTELAERKTCLICRTPIG